MSDKFKSLVHYICDKRSDRPDTLGKVKLNKIAWLSDRLSYLYYRQPITDEIYVKLQFGPVARNMVTTLNELAHDRDLVIRGTKYFGYNKFEYFTLTKPDPSKFSSREIDIVNDAIGYVCDQNTASSISLESHDVVWKAANLGEELPLYTVFATNPGELTESDLAWANSEAERLDL